MHALVLEGLPSVRKSTTRFASARYPGQLAQTTCSVIISIAFPVHVQPELYATLPISVTSAVFDVCVIKSQFSSALVEKVTTATLEWGEVGRGGKRYERRKAERRGEPVRITVLPRAAIASIEREQGGAAARKAFAPEPCQRRPRTAVGRGSGQRERSRAGGWREKASSGQRGKEAMQACDVHTSDARSLDVPVPQPFS